MKTFGLVSIKGSGGPAAVLIQNDTHLLVAQCSGEEDLAVRIVKKTDLGGTRWEQNCPVSQRLLKKVDGIQLSHQKLKPLVERFRLA
jgi:hypothetical protein